MCVPCYGACFVVVRAARLAGPWYCRISPMPSRVFSVVRALMGLEHDSTTHTEKWVAALGAALAIAATAWVSSHRLDGADAMLMTAAMGASTFLLFAVPHGALSQPWAVLAGHAVSALIGVTCARWVPVLPLAAALAVGLAVLAMHYLRCLHPPGGATALVAVIGGDQITALGYGYLWSPVLLNAVTLLLVAVVYNSVFPWRRYPAALARWWKPRRPYGETRDEQLVTAEDVEAAVRDLGLVVDIAPQDLEQLVSHAARHALARHPAPQALRKDAYYSNGLPDAQWAVRKVVSLSTGAVTFRTVAGQLPHSIQSASREQFSRWARYEVRWDGQAWQRVD